MARKYSLKTMLATLRLHHGLVSLAADDLRCSRATIYRYVQEYPEVAAVIQEERERLVDLAEDGLFYHLTERAPWAISLTLKTLGKGRGYTDKGIDLGVPLDVTQAIQTSAEWQEIQHTLLATLERYPEARWAVVDALLERESRESPNGHHS